MLQDHVIEVSWALLVELCLDSLLLALYSIFAFWRSSFSSRSVKSIGSAEVLSAGEAEDEAKIMASTYSELPGISIHLVCAVESKDMYFSLSTCRVQKTSRPVVMFR